MGADQGRSVTLLRAHRVQPVLMRERTGASTRLAIRSPVSPATRCSTAAVVSRAVAAMRAITGVLSDWGGWDRACRPPAVEAMDPGSVRRGLGFKTRAIRYKACRPAGRRAGSAPH